MKKLSALLLALALLFSLAACGGDTEVSTPPKDDPAPGGQQQTVNTPDPGADKPEEKPEAKPEEPAPPAQEEAPVDLSGYLGTKTGKFYSQFTDGRMYMEYEMEMEGQVMTMISATYNDKTYSETKIGGVSAGISIMDGEDMYTIDHTSKMVIKMSIGATAQTIAGTVLEESDVDMGDLETGTREIDGKTYDTESWIIDDAASILCFDGDDLAYMIGAFDGEEMLMKIIEVSDKVDESLFEIPDDYTVLEL